MFVFFVFPDLVIYGMRSSGPGEGISVLVCEKGCFYEGEISFCCLFSIQTHAVILVVNVNACVTVDTLTQSFFCSVLRPAGSNGHEFMFLLKGHEDLRQDERVMQLFGLVNTLLANDPASLRKNLRQASCIQASESQKVSFFETNYIRQTRHR